MTIDEFIEAVEYRLTQGAPQASAGIFTPAIAALEKEALQRLSKRQAMSLDATSRSTSQKTWNLVLAAGEVAIPADLEVAGLAKAVVRIDTDLTHCEFLPEYRDLLDMPPVEGLVCFTAHEDKLKFKQRSGDTAVDPAATDPTVKGSYTKTLAQVVYPSDESALLIDIALEMIQESGLQVEEEAEIT